MKAGRPLAGLGKGGRRCEFLVEQLLVEKVALLVPLVLALFDCKSASVRSVNGFEGLGVETPLRLSLRETGVARLEKTASCTVADRLWSPGTAGLACFWGCGAGWIESGRASDWRARTVRLTLKAALAASFCSCATCL